MKKLYRALCTLCSIVSCVFHAARTYCIDNPSVLSVIKTALVVGGILVAICSAMLWHVSALMQEQLALAENLDTVKMIAATKASAMLNSKAAMLGVVSASMNGLFFWLGTLSSSKDE
ncbi:hypothetical protein [Pseudomonas juntendi]|uniref:hypothetical protein n=1 Tax=Pseudomonas juntendi TaxID=2666183 RepID=UPI001F47AB8C|nr:hypothetical protein [Pseudomonas juntendi]